MSTRRVRPWPLRHGARPTIDLTADVPPEEALATFVAVTRASRYRVTTPSPTTARAVLGRGWLRALADLLNLPPSGPFLHVELHAAADRVVDGARLRVTCRHGGQEVNAGTAVAALLDAVLDRLDTPTRAAAASAWGVGQPI
ncbi:hypothetical protein [Cellulomonas sp. GbtcB1]|uniref:hypothetical protein n=1 Tax=Cellulomonas sp. GbtcB1 TaxID=2824746 RepID=UPI001C309A7B|nr:hypothetical protein [Cellulomonas sp. GbtcB1]